MTAPIEVQGLRKRFGSRRGAVQVLAGVDLTVREGEVLALLGPNGAGKTTIVRILSTLLVPDAGSASVAGFDVARDPLRVRERISLTGQHAAVDLKLTGAENLAQMGRLAHLPRRAGRSRVTELLATFDLTDVASRRVASYSGGERRRLDLAAGLLVRPEVMFLDEPTTGLDPRSRRALWATIRGVVADGTTLLLTTQYLEEADVLADRIALLDAGVVTAEGTAAELKRRVGTASLEFEFADAAAARRAAAVLHMSIPGEQPTLTVPTDNTTAQVGFVLGVLAEAGLSPDRWQLRSPSLDDVFLSLTGRPVSLPTSDSEVAA